MAQSKKTACSHFGEQAEFFMRIIFFTFWEYDYDTHFFLIIRFVKSRENFVKKAIDTVSAMVYNNYTDTVSIHI